MNKKEVLENIKELTLREISLTDISKSLNLNEYEVLGLIRELRLEGINIIIPTIPAIISIILFTILFIIFFIPIIFLPKLICFDGDDFTVSSIIFICTHPYFLYLIYDII